MKVCVSHWFCIVFFALSFFTSNEAYAQGRVAFVPDPPVAGKPGRLIYDATGGPLAGKQKVAIHYGVNNWANMSKPDPVMLPAGPDRWAFNYQLPSNAMSFDFVFSDGGAVWDNNGGQNWSKMVTVPSSRATVSPNPPQPGQRVTIRYNPAGSALAGADKVFLRVTYNNWGSVTTPDPQLERDAGGNFFCSIPMGTDVTSLSFCFTDGADKWDNDDGANWNISVGGSVPQASTPQHVKIEPNPPIAGKPATITYDSTRTVLGKSTSVHIRLRQDGSNPATDDPEMKAVAGKPGHWMHSFMVPQGIQQFNALFHDGVSVADDNQKQGWHFVVEPAGGTTRK